MSSNIKLSLGLLLPRVGSGLHLMPHTYTSVVLCSIALVEW